MLLALKPPSQSSAYSSPHVYSPPRTEPNLSFLSESKLGPLMHPTEVHSSTMSTPHRGLPPPLGMTLPNPNPMSDRGHPPPPPPPPPPSSQQSQPQQPQHPSALQQNQPMGQLPAPPTTQWPGSGDAMRDWLAAKAEEDKRKQEEERTRQETLRLEQRKIEQSMLRESLAGGIPPHMVPIVFAGMGGGNLANAGIEWAQYYMSQMTVQPHPASQGQLPPPPPPPPQAQSQQQQQQQQGSPDLRRDRSYTGPQPNPYAAHQPPQSRGYPFDGSRPGQAQIQAGPTSVPRPSASSLSRLNTGEMSIHQPPPAGVALPTQQSHPSAQIEPTVQSTPNSTSNSIYFHHWVPPNNTKEAGSPSDFTHSPKKRKTNSHGKSPETSPAFSHPASASRRNRALSIQKSEASTDSSRGSGHATSQLAGSHSRPASRHRQHSLSSVVEGGIRHGSVQRELSHTVSPSEEYSRKRSRSGSPRPNGVLS